MGTLSLDHPHDPGPRPPTALGSTALTWTATGVLLIAGLSTSGWPHLLPWLGITALWVGRYRDISHPCFWFPLVFLLYGVSYFIIVEAGLLDTRGDHVFATKMHLIAMVAYLAGASRPSISTKAFQEAAGIRQPSVIWMAFLLALGVSAYHYVGVLGTEGLASKQDIRLAKDGNLALRLAPIYAPLALLAGLVLSRLIILGSPSSGLIIGLVASWGIAGLLITGERDILLRFLIVIAFVWNFQRRAISPRLAVLAFVALIASLPLMQAAKGAILGDFDQVRFGLYGLLGGEFKASGRVLTALLERWPGFMWGETFGWDALRILSFGPFATDTVSTSEWFNRVFVGHDGAGWGFSLVGELYLNFGIPAIALGFWLYGRLSHALYAKQGRSPVWLVGYAVFTSVAVYSIRGDGATLLGSPLKLIILPVLCVLLFEQIATALASNQPGPQS